MLSSNRSKMWVATLDVGAAALLMQEAARLWQRQSRDVSCALPTQILHLLGSASELRPPNAARRWTEPPQLAPEVVGHIVAPPGVRDGWWAMVDVTPLVRRRLTAASAGKPQPVPAGAAAAARKGSGLGVTLAIVRVFRRNGAGEGLARRPADSTADGAVRFDSSQAHLQAREPCGQTCPDSQRALTPCCLHNSGTLPFATAAAPDATPDAMLVAEFLSFTLSWQQQQDPADPPVDGSNFLRCSHSRRR